MRELPRLHPVPVKALGWDGIWLNVWEYLADGPVLFFFHCTGTMGRIWEPVLRRLKGTYHCFTPDARGHGYSAKPLDREAYDWRYYARDITAVLDAMNLDQRVLAVGHSAGATHLVQAASLRPELFHALLLIDPVMAPRELNNEIAQRCVDLAERTRRRHSTIENKETAHERFSSKLPMSIWSEESLLAYISHGMTQRDNGHLELLCPVEIEAWTYEWAAQQQVFEKLGNLELPITLMTGSESDLAPFVEAQYQELMNPQEYITLEATHFIPQEQPETVASIIDQWAGNFYNNR